MSFVLMKAPEGKGFGDGWLKPNKRGHVEVPVDEVETYAAHGFVRTDDAADRVSLIARLVAEFRLFIETLATDELEAQLAASAEFFERIRRPIDAPAPETEENEPEEAAARESFPADPFDAMGRDDLWAWIKERGIAAGPATSTERLRNIARDYAASGSNPPVVETPPAPIPPLLVPAQEAPAPAAPAAPAADAHPGEAA